jgi:hypothetical protein
MRAFFAVGIASAMVTIALGAQAAKPTHKAATKTASQPAAKPAAATPAAATPAAATPAAATPAAATPAATPAPASETAPSTSTSGTASASASTGTNTSWSSSGEGMATAPAAVPFGAAHQLIISVDRAFGVSFWSEKFSLPDGSSTKQSGTAINLLNGSDNDVDGPAATPRVAFDFAVVRNITVGAFFGYSHRSSSSQSTDAAGTQGASLSNPGLSSMLLGLRGGYALALTDMFTVWPRAGFTYYTGHVAGGHSIKGVLVNVEPTLVVTPVSHLGFTLGVVADLPLSGSLKEVTTGTSYTNKVMNFGLAVGLLGYL